MTKKGASKEELSGDDLYLATETHTNTGDGTEYRLLKKINLASNLRFCLSNEESESSRTTSVLCQAYRCAASWSNEQQKGTLKIQQNDKGKGFWIPCFQEKGTFTPSIPDDVSWVGTMSADADVTGFSYSTFVWGNREKDGVPREWRFAHLGPSSSSSGQALQVCNETKLVELKPRVVVDTTSNLKLVFWYKREVLQEDLPQTTPPRWASSFLFSMQPGSNREEYEVERLEREVEIEEIQGGDHRANLDNILTTTTGVTNIEPPSIRYTIQSKSINADHVKAITTHRMPSGVHFLFEQQSSKKDDGNEKDDKKYEPSLLFQHFCDDVKVAPPFTSFAMVDWKNKSSGDLQSLSDSMLLESLIQVMSMDFVFKKNEGTLFNIDHKKDASKFVTCMTRALSEMVQNENSNGFLTSHSFERKSYNKNVANDEICKDLMEIVFGKFEITNKSKELLKNVVSDITNKLYNNTKDESAVFLPHVVFQTFLQDQSEEIGLNIKLPMIRVLHVNVDRGSFQMSMEAGRTTEDALCPHIFNFNMEYTDTIWQLNPKALDLQRSNIMNTIESYTGTSHKEVMKKTSPWCIEYDS